MGTLALLMVLAGGSALDAAEVARAQPLVLDADGDGLPESWETAYQLDDTDPTDDMGEQGDPDMDGITNVEEWRAGTHPRGVYTEYFAEGAMGPILDTRLAVVNADAARTAVVLVRFLAAAGQTVSRLEHVPPLSRRTVDARDVAGIASEFSIEITSSLPVVAERTMEWSGGSGDAHAEGSTSAAERRWFFAEGATHSGFRLFFLISNPGDMPATVGVDYLFPDGAPLHRTHVIAPRSRFTIWANQEHPRLAAAEVSTRFSADVPIVVERAMYTVGPDGRLLAGHAAIGTPEPQPTWYFAEGATGTFFNTFLLLMNPTGHATQVEVVFLRPEGAPVRRTYTVGAQQRYTVWVNHAAPELSATAVGLAVRSLDGTPIVAERAMWWPGDGRGFRASHVTAGLPEASPVWAFAGGESRAGEQDATFVLLANVGDEDATVRVSLLPEDGLPLIHALEVPADSRTNVDVAAVFPAAGGTRYGVLIEALTPGARLVAERSHYVTANGVTFAAGTSTRGRNPRRLLAPPLMRRLARGSAATLYEDVVAAETLAGLDAESSAPGIAAVSIVDGRGVRVSPQPGASGWVTVTLTATGVDGTRETQRFRVKVGDAATSEHTITLSGPATFSLPALGDAAASPEVTTIENIGPTTITGIELFEQGRDWSTVDRILASATAGLTTPDERAHALWHFARTHHVPWWSATINTDLHDPVVVFNGFGYVFCDDISSALGLLFERAGMPARMWNLGVDRHTVVEAYYDGDWHMFDASLDGLFLERDNRTVAGVEDIIADPGLVSRGGWRQDFAYGIWTTPGHFSYPASVLTREGRRMGLTLRPGERLTLSPAVRTGLRYADGSLVSPAGLEPPVLGGGVLASRLDGRQPDALERLRQAHGVAASARGLVRTATVGTATFEVATPWPVVGGQLRATVEPGGPGETVTIDVTASGTGFDFDWSELVSGRFRVPGLHVADGNLRTFTPEHYGPAVHNGPGSTPGYIEYRLSPLRQPGARTRLAGSFYRASASDIVAVQVSADGVRWDTAWIMAPVGGAVLSVDLTEALAACDPCGVRLLVQGTSAPATAGFDALSLEGVEPFGWTPVWSAPSDALVGTTTVEVPLGSLVNSYDGAMVFAYHVRVRLSGSSPVPAALESLALDSNVQAAPQSITQPGAAPVSLVYRDTSAGPRQVRIGHRWHVDEARHRPAAPEPTLSVGGEAIDARTPFHLGWVAPPDPDGDVLITYHVQVCEPRECRYPISASFDEKGTFSNPGADGLFGTTDDGPPVPIISTHWMYLHAWLRAGATYAWRVRVQDASGLWSDWSRPERFHVTAQAPP